MSFTTYAEARPWAAAIREEVLTRQMPPWSAVAGFGHFANDPGLTQGEWDLLVAWVDGGAPSGQTLQEDQVPPVFVPGTKPSGSKVSPTRSSSRMPQHSIPAGAPDQVQRFEVATGFSTDRRVHGIGFKPGDRRVVRYAAVFEAGTNRWLFTWTPWYTTMHLPEGVAYTIKAGAKLDRRDRVSRHRSRHDGSQRSGSLLRQGELGRCRDAQSIQAPEVDVARGRQAVADARRDRARRDNGVAGGVSRGGPRHLIAGVDGRPARRQRAALALAQGSPARLAIVVRLPRIPYRCPEARGW